MPPPYGVTPTGFNLKRFEDIMAEMREAVANAAELGGNINTDAESPMGQLLEIPGGAAATLWEEGNKIYTSQLPLQAGGASLDNFLPFYGTERRDEDFTTGNLTLNGVAATVITAGSIIRTADTKARFIVAGTIGGGGTVVVIATAEDAGPIQVLAGTTWEIVTPITGWTSVSPAAGDFTPGRVIESDGQARSRAAQMVVAGPGSALDAIRTALFQVDGVTEALVIENASPDPDADGRPGHSIECVVRGGDDAELAAAIFSGCPASVQTVTTVSGPNQVVEVVVDDNGDNQTITFSRPDVLDAWIEIDYVPKPAFPDNGEDTMLQSLLDFDATITMGQVVVPLDITDCILSAFDPKVFLTLTIRMGAAASPPTAAPVGASKTDVVDLDSSRILITRVL